MVKYHYLPALLLASATLLGQTRVVTDDIAYSHFFLTLAPPPAAGGTHGSEDSSGSLAERQASYIEHVGLNPEQGVVLIGIAERYRDYLAGLSAQATQIAGPGVPTASPTTRQRAELKLLSNGRRAVLSQLIRELHDQLDDQGDRIVRNYISKRVKTNIRFK